MDKAPASAPHRALTAVRPGLQLTITPAFAVWKHDRIRGAFQITAASRYPLFFNVRHSLERTFDPIKSSDLIAYLLMFLLVT